MQKSILVTGATDGIGYETAKMLLSLGHQVLLHGRNSQKLQKVQAELRSATGNENTEIYIADMSSMAEVMVLAAEIQAKHSTLNAVINNAGVFKGPTRITKDALDIRFAVNALAPYVLTQALLPLLGKADRVVNVSSAAQASVSLDALWGREILSDGEAYAQSKLALTMWSRKLGLRMADSGPLIIAVNPKSLLGSKMVKEAFGMAGSDLKVGADILCRAALSEEFLNASGQYFDNDIEKFADPHVDALDEKKAQLVLTAMDQIITKLALDAH